jgi:SH3-like domain-containing protein
MIINDQQTKRINEAAQRVVVDTLESYRMGWDRLAEANEGQTWLAKNLLEGTMRNLRTKAERNLDAAEELTKEAREGQAAARVLARESADAYMDFLDSLFFYYRENARAAERSTMRG